MSDAAKVLLKFISFLEPLVPEIRKLACRFWECNVQDLGPVPPDFLRWDAADQEIDRQRAAKRQGHK